MMNVMKHVFGFTLLLVLSFTVALAEKDSLTAYEARDLAKREVNDIAREKVVQIIGHKNPSAVAPKKWEVLFYDPAADQDGRMVEVVGRGVTIIKEGYVQLDQLRLAAYKPEEIINPDDMKVDSSKILEILKRSTELEKLPISGLQLWLRKPSKGNVPPVWYVTIYAANHKSGKEVELGEAEISAKTSQILRLEIHPEKLH